MVDVAHVGSEVPPKKTGRADSHPDGCPLTGSLAIAHGVFTILPFHDLLASRTHIRVMANALRVLYSAHPVGCPDRCSYNDANGARKMTNQMTTSPFPSNSQIPSIC
jgi:hypothetical protein